MARAVWMLCLLEGCGGDDPGDGGGDADVDTDTDTGGDADTDTDTGCEADCGTLNISDLAPADETPENITLDPTCETGDYERTIENLVTGADGLPESWTELRVYHPPEKDIRHEIRTEYTVGSRCLDGTIGEMEARMHSLRPLFTAVCDGVYCFDGL